MVSPFIQATPMQGGTLHVFSSASNDMGFTFNNDGKQIKFSYYALLNIPNIARPTLGPNNYENVLQFDAIPGAHQYVVGTKTNNMMLAESFQNYALNFESTWLSSQSFDQNNIHSISERVFFKWLKELGGIRFRNTTTNETTNTSIKLFAEENSSNKYNTVVQMVSEIDVVNSVQRAGDSFSELYINVPTQAGASPLIMFNTIEDDNYFSSQNIINSSSNPLNDSFIYGRQYTDTNPTGLDIYAFFDSTNQTYGATVGLLPVNVPAINTAGEYQLFKYNNAINDYTIGWWFLYPESYSYWTQPADSISLTYDDPTNDSLMIKGVKSNSSIVEVFFQRSRLDGIGIDFTKSDYYAISSNPAINSFSDFNALQTTSTFEFNTVLIYYDVLNVATGASATNLYGVLFLNAVEDNVTGGGAIPSFVKYKPNNIAGLNGNAFGFRVNLKFDINSENTAIVTSINEYAPFSMQLFVNALNELGDAADTLTSENQIVQQLIDEVNSLKALIYSTSDFTALQSRVSMLEQQIATSKAALQNSGTLIDLITRNYNEILNIYNNKTSVAVAYNTNVIAQGAGIFIDKSTPNQIVISNSEQSYNIANAAGIYAITSDFLSSPSAWNKTIQLNSFANYFKISNGVNMILDRNVNIYIDDSQINWNNGQLYKIVVDYLYPMDMYTMGSYTLNVFTDALDKSNSGQAYSVQIASITSDNFYNKAGSPQFEIICINSSNYSFSVDLL